MVRQYMRHGPTQAFGVVCSPTSNSFFDGRLAYVPAWEDVLVWDVKTGEQLSMWHAPGVTSRITSLLASPLPSSSSSSPNRIFAAAYEDGSIRLWSYSSSIGENGEADEVVTFNGHKKGISTLAWDADGSRLASGGVEGEIVLWDRVAEVGLFRLKGHRGAITSLHFIPHPTAPAHAGYLLSTSKDTYMKLWDLSTQHCVQTVVVGRGEVLSAAIREEASAQGKVRAEEGEGDDAEAGRIVVVTGTGDGEARVWAMEKASLAEGLVKNEVGELSKIIHPISTLPLPASSAPITQITAHPTLPLLLLQTSDKVVVALRIRPDDEVLAKLARRKKRAAEKEKEKGKKKGGKGDAGANGNTEQGENGAGGDVEEGEVKWEDKVAVLCTVRANAKVKSFSVGPNEGLKGGVPLMLALSNNALETYLLPSPKRTKKSASADDAPTEPTKTHSIELPGHRNDVRCVAVSSDDNVIASAASGTLKIWNAKSTACIRTMECGYAVCMAFLPGDRHIVLGLKTGELALYDIATSTLMSTYRAHTGSVWGISIRPDGRGLVSGSADKDVKFWDFEMREAEGEGEKVVSRLGVETYHKHKQLTLVHVRTLKMTDDVLSVKYSPDGRLLAVALLDSTVKIFFAKDLKFFLSLYGHKLPVLGMDISGDSKLIITCSADKNIKIWGLDFGDCHKSLFAHDDSVMAVQFERGMDDEMAGGKGKGSHLFWSVGKDRALKYWDADKFELIQRLDGHHGEIWALATSQRGKFVVTGSHDKSIRIWEKTDEPLFLEEERERELEAMYDRNLADEANRATGTAGGDNLEENAEATADGGAGSVEAVTKQTSETLMAGERIIEALEIADAERSALKEWEEDKARLVAEGKDEMADALPRPPMHQELAARGELEPSEFVLQVLKKVPAAQMEDALLVLPFGLVCSLLGYVDEWAKADIETTLSTRILTYLLLTSSNQLSSTRALRTQLLDLRTHLRASLERQKALIGFNLAAMKFVKQRWESEKMAGVMDEQDEEKVRAMMGKGRAKRKRVEVRA